MRWLAPALVVTTACAAFGACSSEMQTTGPGSGGTGAAGPAATELPCDVSELLASECQTCHGVTPAAGVPMSLVTYEDLVAPSAVDPSVSVAERCVVRMQSATAPMPPGGLLPAEDVAILQGWIAAGMPKGDCGGAGGGPGVVCTSGVYWDDPELENEAKRPEMFPGRAASIATSITPKRKAPRSSSRARSIPRITSRTTATGSATSRSRSSTRSDARRFS